jgi:hypothetical protein
MNLNHKTQLAARVIENIVNHTDEDLAVREVYLRHLLTVIQEGINSAETEVSARVAQLSAATEGGA